MKISPTTLKTPPKAWPIPVIEFPMKMLFLTLIIPSLTCDTHPPGLFFDSTIRGALEGEKWGGKFEFLHVLFVELRCFE